MSQTAAAIIALLVGVAVYMLDRQPGSVYFVTHWMVPNQQVSTSFGSLGNHLPTFVHAYAFSLLTVALASASRAHAIAICCFWLVVDSLFEIAQISVIAQAIGKNVPGWFIGVPFLENTSAYFLAGTFDVLDLLSIAAGALAAYVTIYVSNNKDFAS